MDAAKTAEDVVVVVVARQRRIAAKRDNLECPDMANAKNKGVRPQVSPRAGERNGRPGMRLDASSVS